MSNSRVPAVPRKTELFRRLPAIDELLCMPGVAELVRHYGRAAVTDTARQVLAALRRAITAGEADAAAVEAAREHLAATIRRQLQSGLGYSLRPVINATGVVLHTNLGRAPLASAALDHIRATAGVFSNLEFDTASGERGRRDAHAGRLLARLLQDPDKSQETATIVVNNNAAAVLLALNTLAENGEVVVSRGELVEIGGSFRIPDVMSKSGAKLREVGTTNRTRLEDYKNAITEETRLLLRVHRSNFQIVGFTEQPTLAELVDLGRRHNLPVVEDLGSGALFSPRELGMGDEPDVASSLRAGVALVTYSGDKLLGGPQAGLVSGAPEWVARLRRNPLFRALRVDKLTYAALEATLLAYVRQDYDAIPALRFLRLPAEEIARRAEALACRTRSARLLPELMDGQSIPGGGSAPGATLPTTLIALTCAGLSADELMARLRENDPPIVARVAEGKVLLDLRTVFPEQDSLVAEALSRIGAA